MDTEYTKGFRAGQSYEIERIIKLLEELASELNKVKPITNTAYGNWEGVCHAIALIKGENK